MVISFTKSEHGGSISREHKGTGLISRLRAVMSQIGTLLTDAPAQYNVFPTPEQFERMKRNQGCGSSFGGSNNGPSSDELHEEEIKSDRERAKNAKERRERKGSHGMSPRNPNGWN